ncbi:hypothetical protein KKB55_13220 [Myxococcota bacterium]|nr:hypothetical protein [Myxococcota bacterium]MBU1898702.1 hypothetical protein [Myxococcota bacterium]
MMYYDRSVSNDLLDAAMPGGPLGWLVPWVRSDPETRLDFRREDGERKHGGLQVYVGRTSPVEFLGRTGRRVKITAGEEYRAGTPHPHIFATHGAAALGPLQGDIEAHIAACRARMPAAFTSGEAVAHNGLMRRYGLSFRAKAPFLAVDSEIAFGFRGDASYPNGTAHKRDYKVKASRDPDLPAGISPLRKLDTLGVLPDGGIAIVEVKDVGGDLAEAARQVAAHVYNLRQLGQGGGDIVGVMSRMIRQKIALGLIPKGAYQPSPSARLIPVIAAPDARPNWVDHWSTAIAPLRPSCYLNGLQLWRLSPRGEVLQVHCP